MTSKWAHSVLPKTRTSGVCLVVIKLAQDHHLSNDLCQLIEDAYRFASKIAGNSVNCSTPHLYVSVLALWDRRQPIWEYYGKQRRGLLQTERLKKFERFHSIIAVWDIGTRIDAIAVSSDGTRVLVVGKTATIVLDAYTGHEAYRLEPPNSYIRRAIFSPDGGKIFSCSLGSTIFIWDAHTGRLLAGPLQRPPSSSRPWEDLPQFSFSEAYSLAFSQDSSLIMLGSGDGTVCGWNTCTGEALVSSTVDHEDNTVSVTLSSDGNWFATGSTNGRVYICETRTGNVFVGPLGASQRSVQANALAFSPNNTMIGSGFSDGMISIWEVHTGSLKVQLAGGHPGSIQDIAFSPDNRLLASTSDDHTVCVWDAQSGSLYARYLQGHTKAVLLLGFMPDGNRLVSGSFDQSIRVWDIHCLGSEDKTLRIWEAESGQLLRGPLHGHTGWIRTVAFSSDGQRVASGSQEIHIWDTSSGITLFGSLATYAGSVWSVTFSSDGKHVAAGLDDSLVCLWNVETRAMLPILLTGNTDIVTSVVFSLDNSRVVAASGDCTANVWDAYSGEQLAGPVRGPISSAAFSVCSPDGKHIASSLHDHSIWIWDAYTGSVLVGPLRGHNQEIHSMAFLRGMKAIVSAS
ncbi:WD repeat-containing protein [Ceratobasidium sp. AG-Ba]|nr:WD repeat-containing protein [Ceratobasidium sp. AG-Ba]